MLTQWPLASQPPHVCVQDEDRAGKDRHGHAVADGASLDGLYAGPDAGVE